MITFTRLGKHGQLGNQLFQVAMLIGVATKRNYQVKIPKNYDKPKKRGLVELSRFQITLPRLQDKDLRRLPYKFQEKGFEFDAAVFNQKDGTDFAGYFQTEKYFKHAEDTVRQEFTFLDEIVTDTNNFMANLRRRVGKQNVVAVHVRRGDYLDTPELFQILNASYYQKAMRHPALPEDAQFLVFSDDLTWCMENLDDAGVDITYTPNTKSHWHDMALMSACDAHIISASSFSWWGAWLANSPTVIAPTPWFPINGPRGHYNMSDVIPERWIKQVV